MTDQEKITELLHKYTQGTINNDEWLLLQDWVQSSTDHQYLFGALNDEDELREKLADFHPENKKKLKDAIWLKIKEKNQFKELNTPSSVISINALRKWGWAAAVLVVVVATIFFKKRQHAVERQQIAETAAPANEVLPGKNGAVLTLADGKKVVLDSLEDGVVTTQGNTIVALTNGQLFYERNKENEPKTEVYNTMSTPKGRQYQLKLPDGTRVWLNAASSIKFPTAFIGETRSVTLTGEAYFEVTHNKQKPFLVTTDAGTIKVLGTRFNVMAYDNEAVMKTTLTEGSVQLQQGEQNVTLLPGQQVQVTGNTTQVINDVDTEAVLAWKNGWFNFKYMDIQTMMKQVERWYDITVQYEGRIPEKRFNGQLSRNVNLSELLEILQYSDVRFELQNKVLTIKE